MAALKLLQALLILTHSQPSFDPAFLRPKKVQLPSTCAICQDCGAFVILDGGLSGNYCHFTSGTFTGIKMVQNSSSVIFTESLWARLQLSAIHHIFRTVFITSDSVSSPFSHFPSAIIRNISEKLQKGKHTH